MKKNTAAMIFGIIFGIALLPLAYLNLVLGIALAFAKNGWFGYTVYIYPIMGIIAIIGAAFARKKIKVTRIMLAIPNLIHLAVVIYTSCIGLLTNSLLLFAVYAIVAILGILALLLSFLAKDKNYYSAPTLTPPSQQAHM